ncbi:MAG: hypothetical protein GYB65_16170 [Chloroflexi bacterium]|nr:hypothetical protein [Chloroflexota bacterium]
MKTKFLFIGLASMVVLALSGVVLWAAHPASEASTAPDSPANRPNQQGGAEIGQLEWIRVHDVGTGYGPSSDFIDVEVVFKLTNSDHAFGFTLRPNDQNALAHQGMLDVLIDAMANDWEVRVEYLTGNNTNNFVAFRVIAYK